MKSALPQLCTNCEMTHFLLRSSRRCFYLDLTQIPEYSHLPDWWNRRSRGLGGTLDIPLSCGGEENLLCLEEDRSHGDDIFFHETAHAVSVSCC